MPLEGSADIATVDRTSRRGLARTPQPADPRQRGLHEKELGVRRSELALRCGCNNVSKGLRRISSVCQGDLDSQTSKMVLDALPAALEIEKAQVEAIVDDTAKIIATAERRAVAKRGEVYRASIRPHGYLLGTKTCPSQIVFYGITSGAERWQKIRLDLSQPPVTFAAQAHAVVKQTPIVPYFGPTTGFIVNYTPDNAVRFDLDGVPVEQSGRAYRPSEVDVFIGKRRLPAGWGFR
jgi:hypothetical protein